MTSAHLLLALILVVIFGLFIGLIYLAAKGAEKTIATLKEWKAPEVAPEPEPIITRDKMTRNIFNYLRKKGFNPSMDGEQSDLIWITYSGLKLYVLIEKDIHSVSIGFNVELGDSVDVPLLLQCINAAHKHSRYAKAILRENLITYDADFQCNSAGVFRRFFLIYMGSVLEIQHNMSQLWQDADRQNTENSCDRIRNLVS